MYYKGLLYINNVWKQGSGAVFASINPATGETIWQGHAANANDIEEAVHAARFALPRWSQSSLEERLAYIQKFQTIIESKKAELAQYVAEETGKVLWDAASEIAAMTSKLKFALQAYQERTSEKTTEANGLKTVIRFRPHGVVAVYGPYNFPAHLPNGHIIPALLAGNVVILKPSELTPKVAEKVMECWQEAGIPEGVINLVQGEAETGKLLAAHAGIDGIFFTGSSATGKVLATQSADNPGKILALELGGNNPLVVHEVADKKAAAYMTIQSAYITSGQRCTCARRLIVPYGEDNDLFIEALIAMVQSIRVGRYTDTPEAFMGALISNKEADRIIAAQAELISKGGESLVEMKRLDANLPFISPALIDVTHAHNVADVEFFGPLLQLIRVPDLETALQVANNTQYGLSSAIFTDNAAHYDYFQRHIKAGIVNWNRPTTGSSGNLPFGGVGSSGNHRPAGYYASDYCVYPMASNETQRLEIPSQPTAGIAL